MAMMVEQEQDTVLPCQCPDGCTVVYYIKQLSPSDAACSKQIKLPKTEARRFVGDLRHKQRCLVAVMDHQHVLWEFLCTCYGCQYALSRVAVFCNTYQLCAGQYLMFYRDALKRLRISVSSDIPDILHQHFSIGSRGPLQHRLSQISPPPPAALLPAAATAGPNPAVAPAAAYSTAYADHNQFMFSSQVTTSPSRDSNVSTDDLRRSSSSGIDSDHSIPASQGSRDSCSDHLAAVAAAVAVDSGLHDSRSWEGQGVITNTAASCSSRQHLRQLAPAAMFAGGSTATAADQQQQLLLLQAGSGLMSAPLAPYQQRQQQELFNSGAAAVVMAGGNSSIKSPIQCTLVSHEQLSESPKDMSSVLCLQSKQQQQHGQRDQSRSRPNQKVIAAATTAAATAEGLSGATPLRDVATKSADQAKLCMSACATGRTQLPLNQPHHQQQQQQQITFTATRESKPVLDLGAAAAAATVPSTVAAAAAAGPICGSKRTVYSLSESFTERATKRQQVSGHTTAAAAAAGTNAAATDIINSKTNISGNNRGLLRPGSTVWLAEGTGSNTSSRAAHATRTDKIQADQISVLERQISGGCGAAATVAKAPLMQNYNCCNVKYPVDHVLGWQPTPHLTSRGSSSRSRSCRADTHACSGSVYLPGGGYGSYLPACTAWQSALRQQQQQQRAAVAGAGGSCSDRMFHTGMWQQQQQQQMLWANICAHYSSSSSDKNVITAEQVLPLFQTAACGTGAAAAAAAVRNRQYEPRAQSKGAAAMKASAAARSVRSTTSLSVAAAAAASSAAAAWASSVAAAAADAAAPRMIPPKQLFKQQQQQHKLLQQQEQCTAMQGDHCAQIPQQQQQLEINQVTDQISTAAGAAVVEDHGSEWSAICGLLMLSRN